MRKLIKYLSEISGVANEIRLQERIDCGQRMNSAKYWWTGGFDGPPKADVFNAFHFYAKSLMNGAYNPDMSELRKKVYNANKIIEK